MKSGWHLTGLCLLLCFFEAFAQDLPTGIIVIDTVILNGNKVTRPSVILRELQFSVGDTLEADRFPELVSRSQENVFNTALFNLVSVDTLPVASDPGHYQVTIRVIERWYLWPIPYVEFPNRNMNAWLASADFSTLTWGLNIRVFNARGRNETLTLMLHAGFNQSYGFTYQTPYLNKKQTWGFGFGGDITLNKSLITGTTGDKSVYLSSDSSLLQQHVHGAIEAYYRPNLYLYHTLGVHFDYYAMADTLIHTPGYVTDSAADQSFFTLYYKLKLDHRDVRYYPLKGYYFDLVAINNGLPASAVHLFSLQSSFRKYAQMGKRWYWASGATAKWSWPYRQPFYLQRGIGYGRDIIRGFEYYSINGPWFVLVKNNLKWAIVKPRIDELSFIRSSKFRVFPWALFLNLFIDGGYVYNDDPLIKQDNHLVNTLLIGYGVGIDFVTYYDIVIDLNVAMNSLGKPGFFIHFTAPI